MLQCHMKCAFYVESEKIKTLSKANCLSLWGSTETCIMLWQTSVCKCSCTIRALKTLRVAGCMDFEGRFLGVIR